MEVADFQNFAGKKAFEIAYALLRLAHASKSAQFRDQLEKYALELLDVSVREEYGMARKILGAVDYLSKLGSGIGFMSFGNSEILSSEIAGFDSAIKEFENSAKLPDIRIEDLFSNISVKTASSVSHVEVGEASIVRESGKDDFEGEENSASMKAAMRQSAILDKIRQSENCRLRDLEGSFPGISERTLRYDLQKLTEQGLLERLGSGGPGTFYRAKTA